MVHVKDAEGFEGDFYEDDEPLEKIEAAFAAGRQVLTGRPTTRAVTSIGFLTFAGSNAPVSADPRRAAMVLTGDATHQQLASADA